MLVIGFLISTLLSLLVFYFGTGRDKRVLCISLVWLLLIAAISINGFFNDTTAVPPRFLLVLMGALGLGVFLFRRLNNVEINTRLLVLIHGIRVPIEIGLYQLYLAGEVPKIMTFKGWNFDIWIGVSAIVLYAFIMFKPDVVSKRFLLVWNWTGIIFLTVIVLVALLSAPLPIQQLAFDQPNIAVQAFPFVFLPAYIVPIVYVSHILSLVRLRE